jgi:hypothetical protein
VLPPCVRIVYRQAHHEIARVFGNIKRLQQEPEGADLQLCNLVIAPIDGEAKISVELSGQIRVPRGYECFEVSDGTGQHRNYLARNRNPRQTAGNVQALASLAFTVKFDF